MRNRVRAWIWPSLIMATLFVCSGRSQLATPDFGFSIDKLAHFAVFGALATAWRRTGLCAGRAWLAWVLTAGFGALDEYRQSWTPGRSVELDDWIADALGAAVAVGLYEWAPWWRRLMEWRVRRG